MSSGLTIWSLGLLMFCVSAEIARELNFKAATTLADRDRYALSLARQPYLWIGIVLWTMEVVVWLVVLEDTSLAVAFPISTLTYAGTPFAAAMVLGEQLTRKQKTGALMITGGVLCIALSGLGSRTA